MANQSLRPTLRIRQVIKGDGYHRSMYTNLYKDKNDRPICRTVKCYGHLDKSTIDSVMDEMQKLGIQGVTVKKIARRSYNGLARSTIFRIPA